MPVTFLFTDIEASTHLLQHLGDTRAAQVFDHHRRLLRETFEAGGGHELQDQGDGFLLVFQAARDGIQAAVAAQRAIDSHAWPEGAKLRVRMGLHTGEAVAAVDGYVGIVIHRAARICQAGHGGQILISQSTRESVEHDLPDGTGLRDLGSHRLKDLREPEKIFQVLHVALSDDFPPIRSLDRLPHNLPIQLTSFIGRERELAEVRRLLSTTRMLTLTGSGGSGKTRLAVHVAASLADEFHDGVWMVELAPLSDATLVPQTAAVALRVREQPGRVIVDTLSDYLKPRRLLLLLDNCEHLVAASAALAETLLQHCPDLYILATSREPLGFPGETAWRVPNLPLPDEARSPSLDHLSQNDAVRLFRDRAVAVASGFELTSRNVPAVAQVCRRLDGIPLAIELAAARVKVLPVAQIAARLDDRFRLLTGGSRTALPRQQTLQATIDWSHELLSPAERTLWRRLAVFAGGFTLDAVEAVCAGDGVDASEVLDLLGHLVDKSLVVAEARAGRYRLLETIRQYGLDRLRDARETASLGRRHRDWFVRMAEQAEPELRGGDVVQWLNRLDAEYDNLRAALEWSRQEEPDAEAWLRQAGALEKFWEMRGYVAEARMWLEEGLEQGRAASPGARARAFSAAGTMAWVRGDYERAIAHHAESRTLSRQLGDRRGVAFSLNNLAAQELERGDYAAAARLFEESLSLYRELDDPYGLAQGLNNLGVAVTFQQDYERAVALLTECLVVARAHEDKLNIAHATNNLGRVALERGDLADARSLLRDSLTMRLELGDKRYVDESFDLLAGVVGAQGQPERAARLGGAAEALRELLSIGVSADEQKRRERYFHPAVVSLSRGAFDACWTEGRAMTLQQAFEFALSA